MINIEIDEEGNITNASMLSGVNKVIDQSIIDVIKKMPPWQPASANGIPIPSRQVIGYNISY
ncbi:MAG TPA: energy transducer TonB [Bacteroidales bacterium]|nr:energy transducer TonB [Bacteroidales bacterium]